MLEGPSLNPKKEDFPLNPEADTEAFKFHQDRFKKIAEVRSKKLINRVIRKKINPIDVAHKEALRDNADFKKRKNEEFQEWERMGKPALEHFKAKKNDPEGEGKKYKTLILVLGGGKKVAQSAGQLTAMHYMGYKNAVEEIFGVSGGGPVAAYYVAGEDNGRKGTSIFTEEANDREFFTPHRFSQMIKIRHLGRAWRSGPKALDTDAISNSRTKLRVAVSKKDQGKVSWVDVKTAKPDMVSALEATGNIPFFKGEGIEVNGEMCYDGSFAQIDLEEIIKMSGATDIIILPNKPFEEMDKIGASFLPPSVMNKIPNTGSIGIFKKFLEVSKELKKVLKDAKETEGVNIAVLWPPDSGIGNTTMNVDDLKASIYESARATFKAFGEEVQDVQLYRTPK